MADEARDIFGDRIRYGDVIAYAFKDKIYTGTFKEVEWYPISPPTYMKVLRLTSGIAIEAHMRDVVILRRYSGVSSHQP